MSGNNGSSFRVLAPSGRLAVAELARAGGGAGKSFRNAYESSRWSPNRTLINASNRDAKVDVCAGPRKSIMAQSRWLYQNMPVYTGIVEALVTYVVGSGIIPAAASSDPEWNRAARDEFRIWSGNPELRTRVSWGSYQKICVRGVLVDGEFFTQLTQGTSGLPRIAMIESHRVTDPDSRKLSARAPGGQEPDGIETGANGRVARWLVPYVVSNGKQKVRKIREASMVQSWLPIRPEQYRGITMFASAVDTSRDLADILLYEKSSVKRLSSRTDVVETQSGDLDPEAVLRDLGGAPAGDCPEEDATRYYRDVIGSETVVMRTGDKYSPVESDRPSAAWQGFVDFLVQSVCQVTGVPFNVLVPVKVGGADTRRDLARAARVFESWQSQLTTGWQRVYEYVIADAMRKGRVPPGPADWWKTEWQFPKNVTVDYGREAKEDRADVKSGLITLEEYWSRYGLDWRDQVGQLKAEADEVKSVDEDLYARIYEEPNTGPPNPEEKVEPDAVNGG